MLALEFGKDNVPKGFQLFATAVYDLFEELESKAVENPIFHYWVAYWNLPRASDLIDGQFLARRLNTFDREPERALVYDRLNASAGCLYFAETHLTKQKNETLEWHDLSNDALFGLKRSLTTKVHFYARDEASFTYFLLQSSFEYQIL